MRGSHKDRLPPSGLTADDIKAVAAHIHSILALAPGQVYKPDVWWVSDGNRSSGDATRVERAPDQAGEVR